MKPIEKLKEIAEHLKEWIDCEPGDGCGKCDEMRNIIKELTDLAEETTELVEVSFKTKGIHEPVTAYFETACCKVSPIYNENYCPNCGRKIKK